MDKIKTAGVEMKIGKDRIETERYKLLVLQSHPVYFIVQDSHLHYIFNKVYLRNVSKDKNYLIWKLDFSTLPTTR